MATETCKMCGDYATPYHHIEELNGHICSNCGYILAHIETHFEKFIDALSQETTPEFGKKLEDAVSPRTIKKGIYATVRKWCDMHYLKKGTN